MDLVRADEIEKIVGVERDDVDHYGRAVSGEQKVYILHSRLCRETRGVLESDLRDCPYSRALDDLGINPTEWIQDEPALLAIRDGRLVPVQEVRHG